MSWFNQKGASTDIRYTLETREHNYRYVRSLKKNPKTSFCTTLHKLCKPRWNGQLLKKTQYKNWSQ